ncbi:hypothetical protein EWM64_g8355 [Hericium alpestre]|uniref:Methyltransferase type 11 domain-containing protein n=1 Tax=Hericium alpestre TaxID=135208 RepID=A0A4Y9ZNN2_9AGAM|nr:hypothetical protein EWM64_g8355 [Hericium alpestre]
MSPATTTQLSNNGTEAAPYMFKIHDWGSEWKRLMSVSRAIHAASTYPKAEVIAADKTDLPPRPLPSNLKFHKLNIMEPFPFEPESFDVIHIRLVLFHLPNPPNVIRRVIELLKPGGWLLLEDLSMPTYDASSGPAQHEFRRVRYNWMVAQGLDPYISEHMAQILEESHAFRSVHTHKPYVCLNPVPEGDDPLAAFSRVHRVSVIKALGDTDITPELRAEGFTKELQEAWKAEMNDPSRKSVLPFYFAWAQKA